jgi:hypothetical protein
MSLEYLGLGRRQFGIYIRGRAVSTAVYGGFRHCMQTDIGVLGTGN